MEFIDEYIAHLYRQIRKDIENTLLNPLKKQLVSLENKLDEKEEIIIDIKNTLNQLKDKNSALENKLNKPTKTMKILAVKERIQNQLSYKLGKEMIKNSKSFKDYLKLPFILYKIKKYHKALQNQPKLESLPDYKEALKLKNHLSYKLGQALIKASKYWFCGGYIWLIFEIQKIKKNYKK